MSDVSQLLRAIQDGDPQAATQLLSLVYDQLRALAAQKLAQESPGQTLQPTALVHEAFLRLVGTNKPPEEWAGRGHFFAAAAEAMRRILVASMLPQLASRSHFKLQHTPPWLKRDTQRFTPTGEG
jgi:RNA polymerase sigma factor (TIGR02999 family)